MEKPHISSLSKSDSHTFKKLACESINLLKGLGVEGDAHMGKTVKHRSRVARDPTQPNLRQVHLIHMELLEELSQKDFIVQPGAMGENMLTSGVDLLNLPKDAILHIGAEAKVQITGLRSPCKQLNSIKDGLMKALVFKNENGDIIRKSGIMGIVLEGGIVNVGDGIEIEFPEKPYVKLEKV